MTYAALKAENQRLREENQALRRRVGKLEAEVKKLRKELEEARRAGKRQATPFSKGGPKANPKRPGRKVGHAAAHRATPERVDRVEEARLPEKCPGCGGGVKETRVEPQYQVEIPPVKPVVTQFNVHIGECQECGRRVQGRHREQTSDALGAAAVQVGPRALSVAAEMKHDLGVPYGKVKRMFQTVFGVEVSGGALARADQRVAKRHQGVYQQLIMKLRGSEVVCGDETGWKVGGEKAWLWVFTNQEVTVYTVEATRAHEVAEEILGEEFNGVLNCDCFLAYDALAYQQQKCLQHLVRRCDGLQESKSGRAVKFSREVAQMLRGAIHLQHRWEREELTGHGFAVARGRLEAELDRLLAGNYSDSDNARLAKLLRKHREKLFLFLYQAGVDPTNAEAEPEIRPAVVVRKTCGCNRSWTGAEVHALLTSVIRICRKQGKDFLELAIELMRDPTAPLPKWLTELLPTGDSPTAVPMTDPPTARPP